MQRSEIRKYYYHQYKFKNIMKDLCHFIIFKCEIIFFPWFRHIYHSGVARQIYRDELLIGTFYIYLIHQNFQTILLYFILRHKKFRHNIYWSQVHKYFIFYLLYCSRELYNMVHHCK